MYRHVDDKPSVDNYPMGPKIYPVGINGLGRVLDGDAADAATAPINKSFFDKAIDAIANVIPFSALSQPISDAWRSTPEATRSMMPPAGPAKSLAPIVKAKQPVSIWSRISDLESFGFISPAEAANLTALVSADPARAERAVQQLEDRAHVSGPRKPAASIVGKIDDKLPPGYKTNEQLISGVPNFVLYAGVGVFGLLTLNAMRKK